MVIFVLPNKHLLKAVHVDMDGLVAIVAGDGIVFLVRHRAERVHLLALQ
jgi:hypothetical protein